MYVAVRSEIKNASAHGGVSGGEGGIRTREPLRVTRAPGVRAKPDYATSPLAFRADELYQTECRASSAEFADAVFGL